MKQSAMGVKRGWIISTRSSRAQIFFSSLTPGCAALARGYPAFSPFGLASGSRIEEDAGTDPRKTPNHDMVASGENRHDRCAQQPCSPAPHATVEQ